MHALAQSISLRLSNSVIDFSPITVAPDTQLLDAITLMNQHQPQASYLVVVENLQILGWLTERDVVRLLSLGIDFNTTQVSEAMASSEIALNYPDDYNITSVLSMLREHQLPLLPVLNEQGQLIGCITFESICQALEIEPEGFLEHSASEDLKVANEQLEMRVAERTEAFKEINRQLVYEIADRLLVEESLLCFRKAIESTSDAVGIIDLAGKPIYVNPAFTELFEYTLEELLKAGRPRAIYINHAQAVAILTTIQLGESWRGEVTMQTRSGRILQIDLRANAIKDSTGKIIGLVGIHTDITERKRTELAALVSQERLQHLLSSSPGVIYTSKTSGDELTTFISENVVTMMGYEAREFIENSTFWLSHIHPEDMEAVLVERSNLFEQGQRTHEYRFLHKDGTYRWVYDQAKLVRDDAGKPLEIIGYWADITKRKQLEEELRSALLKEKELNELKSRFITMTSHEFRTPLSTILSSAELLEHYRHRWNEEKQLTYLRRIQCAVKHMNEILNDVLIIGRAEAGRLDFRPTQLELVEYCRNLVEEIQLNVKNQHAIAFSSQNQSILCCMDEKLLGHILSNLLSNAIKYSPTSSTVKFTLTLEQEQAVFEIQDRGIGIPPEDLPHLFESFHRATNVGNIQGTGLGLAIVKNCVDTHKGEITVRSVVDMGTTFTVTLPLGNS